ncbi:MAG: hypothetical protein AB7T49_21685 [Oligoflexales bacterium]
MQFQEANNKCLVLVALILLVAGDPLNASEPQMGTVVGSAVFVDEGRRITLGDAPRVAIELDYKGQQEKIISDDGGDFIKRLAKGTWCLMSARDSSGEELKFARGQHKCFKIVPGKDTRFDIMLLKP